MCDPMATMYITSNIATTQRWVGKIKQAIKRSKKNITSATAQHGKRILQNGILGQGGAPVGVRTGTRALRNSGVVQSFGDQAILSIRPDNSVVALVNELGMKEPKFLRFDQFPELRDWAAAKYWKYNPKMKGLKVGKPDTTAFGKKNVFWLPLFEKMGRDTPLIMAREIEKEIQKLK